LAEKYGLKVMAGAWIDRRLNNNEKEIDTLIAQARHYPGTINRVIVGNEVLLRNDISADDLMAYLDCVRAALHQPVSTAEPWHIGEKDPELVHHVDFLTVHLFPYWHGIARKDAIADALARYNHLKLLYPGK